MSDETGTPLNKVCEKVASLKLLLGLSAAGLGLFLLWLPFVEPWTGTYGIVVLGIVTMFPFVVISSVFLRLCRRRQEKQRREVARRHRQNK